MLSYYSKRWKDSWHIHRAGPNILLGLFLILPYTLLAQRRAPAAAWLLPGISWRPAHHLRLSAQLGYNHYLRTSIFYPQAYITITKHIILNPAYIYAVTKMKGSPIFQEHYLMNAIILQAGSHNFAIDDRNLLWNRFTVNGKARHYYRNRFRINQSFKVRSAIAKLYVYDEIFIQLNYKNPARNRAAIGLSCDLTSKLNVDVTYIRQWDRYSGPLNLFFLAAGWQL